MHCVDGDSCLRFGGITDQLTLGSISHEEERQQDDAYKAFLKEQNPAKKIQLGDGFLQKYPKSPLAERVDAGLMNVYRSQQDWKDTYRLADSALALQPDDVEEERRLCYVGMTRAMDQSARLQSE